ncbi:hypothetical protein [Tenacibaculum sp. C7A-26P2]|uniref:hypothetical protein n=1 Tax=Tenacibaculum sp. C7A-26P2 TaxID=3447504 RepID=UPI003F862367
MVILKKIKASSLNEVIIATVIIVLVFAIAVAILNNILINIAHKREGIIDKEMNELIYSYSNGELKLPYHEESEDLSIQCIKLKSNEIPAIRLRILNKKNKKVVERKILVDE